MRKYVVSTALLAALGGAGCQLFTTGEKVSEPDPGSARASRDAYASTAAKPPADAHGHDHPHANPHANPHGDPAKAKEADDPAAAAAPVETATASHILIRYAGATRTGPEVTRTKAEAQKLAEQIAKKAAGSTDFGALADQYTEDPSGKGRGGKLGTFGRGRMVPEFDKATFGLAAGQTSGVVETSFGFHIIHREK